LVARGAHVPAGVGRLHEAKINRALALLPYVDEAVAFAPIGPRIESVLVAPTALPAGGRPTTTTVMSV
ncbi:MAG: hypothetical protein NT062_30775, partial [Proteobacteria bacterium]|nr:hypothetical protein [Pseudomonadota bacterium]